MSRERAAGKEQIAFAIAWADHLRQAPGGSEGWWACYEVALDVWNKDDVRKAFWRAARKYERARLAKGKKGNR